MDKVLAQGGDYVLTAKDNQPTLCEDIATLFNDPKVVAETVTTTRRTDLHGSRIEVRALQASSALTGSYCGWPGLQQVFRLERQRIDKRTGARTVRVVFGITSLKPAQADAKRLAAINRGRRGHRKPLALGARCRFRQGCQPHPHRQGPQVMAVFRDLAISFLGLFEATTVPIEGLRHSHGILTRPPNSSPNVLA